MTRFELIAAFALLPAAVLAAPADDLLEAARFNDVPRVLNLLEATDVDAVAANGTTALHVAAGFGYTELVHTLIERGADIDAGTALGKTPLMVAAQEGYSDVAGLLIEAGADTDVRDAAGATALTWAQGYGHRDIVAALQLVTDPVAAPDAGWRWLVTGIVGLFSLIALRHVHETPRATRRLALSPTA